MQRNRTTAKEGRLVIYDLRDVAAWQRAHEERGAWGRRRSKVHTLDNDHVIIEFEAGRKTEASA